MSSAGIWGGGGDKREQTDSGGPNEGSNVRALVVDV
jgi:hypothetical protein